MPPCGAPVGQCVPAVAGKCTVAGRVTQASTSPTLSLRREPMQTPCACAEEAALVKATADLMRLPHVAVNTALVFLHRFNSALPSLGIPENVSPLLHSLQRRKQLQGADSRACCAAVCAHAPPEACGSLSVPGYQSRRGPCLPSGSSQRAMPATPSAAPRAYQSGLRIRRLRHAPTTCSMPCALQRCPRSQPRATAAPRRPRCRRHLEPPGP